jgi:hypothetical protein
MTIIFFATDILKVAHDMKIAIIILQNENNVRRENETKNPIKNESPHNKVCMPRPHRAASNSVGEFFAGYYCLTVGQVQGDCGIFSKKKKSAGVRQPASVLYCTGGIGDRHHGRCRDERSKFNQTLLRARVAVRAHVAVAPKLERREALRK